MRIERSLSCSVMDASATVRVKTHKQNSLLFCNGKLFANRIRKNKIAPEHALGRFLIVEVQKAGLNLFQANRPVSRSDRERAAARVQLAVDRGAVERAGNLNGYVERDVAVAGVGLEV